MGFNYYTFAHKVLWFAFLFGWISLCVLQQHKRKVQIKLGESACRYLLKIHDQEDLVQMVQDAYTSLECNDYYGSFVALKPHSFNAWSVSERLRFQNLNILHQNVLETQVSSIWWLQYDGFKNGYCHKAA